MKLLTVHTKGTQTLTTAYRFHVSFARCCRGPERQPRGGGWVEGGWGGVTTCPACQLLSTVMQWTTQNRCCVSRRYTQTRPNTQISGPLNDMWAADRVTVGCRVACRCPGLYHPKLTTKVQRILCALLPPAAQNYVPTIHVFLYQIFCLNICDALSEQCIYRSRAAGRGWEGQQLPARPPATLGANTDSLMKK